MSASTPGVLLRCVGVQNLERQGQSKIEWVLGLGLAILIVGLTGGLHSPVLAGIPAILALIAIQHGWSRVTQVASSLAVAAVLAIPLLPPPCPRPHPPPLSPPPPPL